MCFGVWIKGVDFFIETNNGINKHTFFKWFYSHVSFTLCLPILIWLCLLSRQTTKRCISQEETVRCGLSTSAVKIVRPVNSKVCIDNIWNESVNTDFLLSHQQNHQVTLLQLQHVYHITAKLLHYICCI